MCSSRLAGGRPNTNAPERKLCFCCIPWSWPSLPGRKRGQHAGTLTNFLGFWVVFRRGRRQNPPITQSMGLGHLKNSIWKNIPSPLPQKSNREGKGTWGRSLSVCSQVCSRCTETTPFILFPAVKGSARPGTYLRHATRSSTNLPVTICTRQELGLVPGACSFRRGRASEPPDGAKDAVP